MRQERTVQATIFEVFAQHEIGCELKAMSQWLDGQPALISWWRAISVAKGCARLATSPVSTGVRAVLPQASKCLWRVASPLAGAFSAAARAKSLACGPPTASAICAAVSNSAAVRLSRLLHCAVLDQFIPFARRDGQVQRPA